MVDAPGQVLGSVAAVRALIDAHVSPYGVTKPRGVSAPCRVLSFGCPLWLALYVAWEGW